MGTEALLPSVTFRECVESGAQKKFIPLTPLFPRVSGTRKAQTKGLLGGPTAPTLLRQQPLLVTLALGSPTARLQNANYAAVHSGPGCQPTFWAKAIKPQLIQEERRYQ